MTKGMERAVLLGDATSFAQEGPIEPVADAVSRAIDAPNHAWEQGRPTPRACLLHKVQEAALDQDWMQWKASA